VSNWDEGPSSDAEGWAWTRRCELRDMALLILSAQMRASAAGARDDDWKANSEPLVSNEDIAAAVDLSERVLSVVDKARPRP